MASPPRAKKDSTVTLSDVTLSKPTGLSAEHLHQQARWIRDTLDPQVAQEGPDALHSDEILTLDELLRKILENNLSLEDIRYSRMHLAICDIVGRATRWPKKLIDRSEAIKDKWEAKYGPLIGLGTPLYEVGGRLNGICGPADLSTAKLIIKWLKSPGAKLSPAVARRSGDLGFVPGEWWISPLFAHRAGIIDSGNSKGGIVSDANGAYAIVMTGTDELPGNQPENFQYRARENDPGRYRLTAATPESRHPIRILRSHSLHCFWKPKAGLRYDGLHKVTGWAWKKDPDSNEISCVINFKRLPNELSMETVVRRPWTDEVEDYAEYKRLRNVYRQKMQQPEVAKPTMTLSVDGAITVFEDETAQTPFQEQFTDRLPPEIEKIARRHLGEASGN